MSLPKAVQEQNALAEQLIAQGITGTEPTPEAIVEQQSEPQEQPAAEPAPVDTPAEEPKDPDFQPITEKPAPYAGDESVKALKEEIAIRDQRYLTLSGKYNAEVPRLRAQVKELQGQQGSNEKADQLYQETLNLKAEIARLTQAKAVDDNKPLDAEVALDALGEEYGPDLIARVKDLINAKTGQITSQVNDVSKNVNQIAEITTGKQRSDDLVSKLKAVSINFKDVNDDPLFESFLQSNTTIEGNLYKDVANHANKNGNLDVVVKIFTEFKDSLRQSTDLNLSQDPDPTKLTSTQSSAPAGQEMASPSGQQVGGTEFDHFYEDVRRGKYAGREEEANRIEQELFAKLA